MDAPSNSSVSRKPKGHTEEVNKSTLIKETNKVEEHHDASSRTTSITAFTSEDKDAYAEELSSKNAG